MPYEISNKNKALIQVFGDLAIPLLGYLFWDWGIYFILLFFLIDLVVNEIMMIVKSRDIVHYQKKGSWISFALISVLTVIALVFLSHLVIKQMIPEINFKDEIIFFWEYEDLGVKQGYILPPLLLFVAYMQYKSEFLLPKLYEKKDLTDLWKPYIKSLFVAIGATGVLLGINNFVMLSEGLAIVFLLSGITLYRVFSIYRSEG